MTTTFASIARLALFVSAIAFVPGCGGAAQTTQGGLGQSGDLCYAGNIATHEPVVTCGAGFVCPPGNPDVSRYCIAAEGQAGDLCYAGNIATHEPVVTCGAGFVCPPGNPDVSRYCVAATN